MIFVDSNIPMYLVGAPHPHKDKAQQLLQDVIRRGERLVTDAEVLQEILHRYVTIKRPEAIQPAFDAVLGVVDDVLSIDLRDIERAKTVVQSQRGLSARDAIHVAVMERASIHRILTFDSGFDSVPGISRVIN